MPKSAGPAGLAASPLLVRELVQSGPAVGPRGYARLEPTGGAGVVEVTDTTGSTRLRALREERGWTQQEVAEQLSRLAFLRMKRHVGVNADMVAKWERG